MPQIKFETRIQTGAFPYAEDVGDTIGIAEYLGKSSTISLTVYNPKRDSGRITIGCLHSFNNNFCAGAELLTQWEQCALKYRLALAARYVWFSDFLFHPCFQSIPLIALFFLCASAYMCTRCAFFNFNSTQITRARFSILCHEKFHCRYSMKKSSVAATVSKDALDISFWHQANSSMQLGASFIWILKTPRPLISFCYQLEMKDSIVKAMIDTDCAVGCTYSR